MWDPDDKERTALHEAGHAVVAWSFGLTVECVYLDLEKEGGNTLTDRAGEEKLCEIEHIAIALAGYASESIFKPPARKAKAIHDFHTSVPQIFRRYGVEDEREQRTKCRQGGACSKGRLRDHEAKVRRVAQECLARAIDEALSRLFNSCVSCQWRCSALLSAHLASRAEY